MVDTLRPDHLGVYGHSRDTSPWLDEAAGDGAVFTEARAPSPWTLPSTRALLTGRVPEKWDPDTTLAHAFAEAGWATASVSASPWLSETYDMTRAWGTVHRQDLAHAMDQIDVSAGIIDAHVSQDLFLFVHLLDPHLPYTEPEELRSHFAPERAPLRLMMPLTSHLLRDLTFTSTPTADEEAYVRARYDQNILAVDAALAVLAERLGPGHILAVTSDHGEEFWEHGGVEHGHALWPEVIGVPLIVTGHGVVRGRYDTPVSLLDVAPTLLELSGLSVPPGLGGQSLAGLVRGGSPPRAARSFAMGHTLYGFGRWGLWRDGRRYELHAGTEQIYAGGSSVGAREGELAGARAAYTEVTGRRVGPALRVVLGGPSEGSPDGRSPLTELSLTLTHAGGLGPVWWQEDARGLRDLAVTRRADGLHLAREGTKGLPQEIWIGPPDDGSLGVLSLELELGSKRYETVIPEVSTVTGPAELGALGPSSASIEVGWGQAVWPEQ